MTRAAIPTTAMGPAPRPSRGRQKAATAIDLAARILDSAEHLFARHGFYGVTTRQVASEAGVDASLLRYYFSSKAGLFEAVFLRRAEMINAERLESLEAYAASHAGAVTPEGAIGAFLDPLIHRSLTGGQGWKSYFLIVAQVNDTPDWGGETMSRFFDPVVQRLVALLRDALPAARDEDLYWGYQFLTGAMMLVVSETGRIDRLSKGLCRSSDLEAARIRLIEYCAAGFQSVAGRRPAPANDIRG